MKLMSISAIFSISVFYAFLSTFPNQPSPHLSDPQQWQNGQLKLPQLQKFEEILKGWVEPRGQETNRKTNNNNKDLSNKRTTSDPETNTKNQATSNNVEIRIEETPNDEIFASFFGENKLITAQRAIIADQATVIKEKDLLIKKLKDDLNEISRLTNSSISSIPK